MRKLACLFFLLFTGNTFSQITYTSYFTQSYPTIFTTEIQDITRTIIFEPQTITITTEVKGGKEIEVLDIEGHNMQGGSITFLCKGRNNQNISIAIPKQEQVEVIDYYYYSPDREEETQLRFHVELTK